MARHFDLWDLNLLAATCAVAVLLTSGCASPRSAKLASGTTTIKSGILEPKTETSSKSAETNSSPIQRVAFAQVEEPQADMIPPAPSDPADAGPADSDLRDVPITLARVTDSIRQTYPLLEAAFLSRNIAAGEQLSAAGSFDLKVKGASESGPLGFYETYRHSIGVEQPTYGGGNFFAGYRIGRGFFQPWYQERQTNDGGEFKSGFSIPLAQNRRIDERRAALWQATYGRQRVEPEIDAQLIEFILFGSFTYWEWVAAGRNVGIAESLLELATDRQEALQERVKEGDLEKIALTDNERLIVSRQAKLTDARRKLRQTAVKLSLFLRQPDGTTVIPSDTSLPESFPVADPIAAANLPIDIDRALENRPELQMLALSQRQLEVDLAQAHNQMKPALDAAVTGSQDMGKPTSKKRDKSEFELEAALFLTVPVQRRKARGKMQSVEGKLAQLSIKRRFTEDKITTEVQATYAALTAAFQRIEQARRAFDLAVTMEQAERTKFGAGQSNLLDVNIRETQTAGAASTLVEAQLEYFQAKAAYRAALALDVAPQVSPGP